MKLSLTWFQVAAHIGIEKPQGETPLERWKYDLTLFSMYMLASSS